MLTQVYLLDISGHLNYPVTKYLDYLPVERRESILRYKFLPDQNRTLWAELLAKKLIAGLLARNFQDITIKRDSSGRPYHENICFSLSHCSNWVACSIGDNINGVDIEIISRRASLKISKRFYLQSEHNTIKFLHDNGQDWERKFFEYWTLKESCLKCLNLNNWAEVDCEKLLSCNHEIAGRNFFLNDLVIACCSQREYLPNNIIILEGGNNFING